jgi:hypothetical protein
MLHCTGCAAATLASGSKSARAKLGADAFCSALTASMRVCTSETGAQHAYFNAVIAW